MFENCTDFKVNFLKRTLIFKFSKFHSLGVQRSRKSDLSWKYQGNGLVMEKSLKCQDIFSKDSET